MMKAFPIDEPVVHDEVAYPRVAGRGRTYVYVLPCRDEDLLKVGFSRDPLDRLRTLHRRFFEFFDLDRGLLIHTDHLRDARQLERLFITTFAAHNAPAPFGVPASAGGHTEWFCGVASPVDALARQLCAEQGYALHAPLGTWLRERLGEWSDRLFDWSAHMLERLEYEHFNLPPEQRDERGIRALRDMLDAYVALGIEIQGLVPTPVLAWYRHGGFAAR